MLWAGIKPYWHLCQTVRNTDLHMLVQKLSPFLTPFSVSESPRYISESWVLSCIFLWSLCLCPSSLASSSRCVFIDSVSGTMCRNTAWHAQKFHSSGLPKLRVKRDGGRHRAGDVLRNKSVLAFSWVLKQHCFYSVSYWVFYNYDSSSLHLSLPGAQNLP